MANGIWSNEHSKADLRFLRLRDSPPYKVMKVIIIVEVIAIVAIIKATPTNLLTIRANHEFSTTSAADVAGGFIAILGGFFFVGPLRTGFSSHFAIPFSYSTKLPDKPMIAPPAKGSPSVDDFGVR